MFKLVTTPHRGTSTEHDFATFAELRRYAVDVEGVPMTAFTSRVGGRPRTSYQFHGCVWNWSEVAETPAVEAGQQYVNDRGTVLTVTRVDRDADGTPVRVIMRNESDGFVGMEGAFFERVATGSLTLIETAKVVMSTTAESLALLAVIDAEQTRREAVAQYEPTGTGDEIHVHNHTCAVPCEAPARRESEAAEPVKVLHGNSGTVWHLVDRDGNAVSAGERFTDTGLNFTIDATPDATCDRVTGEPVRIMVTWNVGRGSWAKVGMLVSGWHWIEAAND